VQHALIRRRREPRVSMQYVMQEANYSLLKSY